MKHCSGQMVYTAVFMDTYNTNGFYLQETEP
jgi:hypothetical protein